MLEIDPLTQALLAQVRLEQALRMQAVVSSLFILVLGCLCFVLWQRHGCLFEALVAEIKRHSAERIGLLKQHSLERSSEQLQMLHAFEGIVFRRYSSSPSPTHYSPRPPHDPPTTPQPLVPRPRPPPRRHRGDDE